MKKDPRKGEQVRDIDHLADLIGQQRSVFVPGSLSYSKPMPAAFAINLTGATIRAILKSGLYVYEKPRKP